MYLVFSKKPDSISAEEYDRWYELHAQENIESPGFQTVRRYSVDQVNGEPAPYHHLAAYEYDGEMSEWRASLTERIASKDIRLPEWFPEITFGSFDIHPISGLMTPQRPR
jgi:hypothetical protein